MWWFERRWPPKGVVVLEGVTLQRKCVTVGAGFAPASLGVTVDFLLPSGHDVAVSAPACLPAHHHAPIMHPS